MGKGSLIVEEAEYVFPTFLEQNQDRRYYFVMGGDFTADKIMEMVAVLIPEARHSSGPEMLAAVIGIINEVKGNK